MLIKLSSKSDIDERCAKPYCQCWNKKAPVLWTQLGSCTCGEDNDVSEWGWTQPDNNGSSWVVVSEDKKQVTFHPLYSSGTAAAKGDTPLLHNYHYYWEVKILTETYGTDIMVGLGSDKVNVVDSQFIFTSLLGKDDESYGLSYTGAIRHNGVIAKDSVGFCRGSIVGVRVDMWRGTLEYYVNRKPQGVAFYNLRRHEALYPMICSTAAQSSMRLIYAASWRASLLVDAAKILASTLNSDRRSEIPPGLQYTLRSQFWLTLPSEEMKTYKHFNVAEFEPVVVQEVVQFARVSNLCGWNLAACDDIIEDSDSEDITETEVKFNNSVLNEVLPSPYINGFYVDSVERDYRVVVWE